MANTTTNLGLKQWNLTADHFDFSELSTNFGKIDTHDHTSGKGLQIPTGGIANGAVTQAKIATDAVGASQIAGGSITPAKLQGAPSLAIGQVPVMGVSGFVAGSPNGMLSGTLGTRPAAGFAGRQYLATDTGDVWFDNGSTWVFLYATARAEIAAGPSTVSYLNAQWGALTNSVTGAFTLSGSNQGLVVTTAGVYRLSVKGSTNSFAAGQALIVLNGGAAIAAAPQLTLLPTLLVVTKRLAAGDSLHMEWDASAEVTVQGGLIERIAP